MLTKLSEVQNRVVGSKQTRKALKNKEVKKLFIAKDADEQVIEPLIKLAEQANISVDFVDTMNDLGKVSGIEVGAASAAILKE